MRQRTFTRMGIGLLALAAVFCGASPAIGAVRPESSPSTQIAPEPDRQITPLASAWLPDDFLRWSPQTDKDLAFNKSTVPLARRIPQADLKLTNPTQNRRTKVVALSAMNPHTSGNPSRGLNSLGNYPFDYWQYVDTLVYWAGSASEGLIVPPSADVIDEAHTNGVPVLGVVFMPPQVYGGKIEWVRTMLQQDADGSYPFAKQLVKVAQAYGFDGWFINQETEGLNQSDATRMKQLIQQARSLDPQLQVMWYDSMTKDGNISYQNQLDDQNATFISPDAQGPAAGAMFLNFWWRQAELKNSAGYAKAHRLDPHELYAGIDVQEKDVQTGVDWPALASANNSTHTSIGLYQPNSTFTNATDFADYQQREATMWVNPQGDPRLSGSLQSDSWIGLSHFVTERSAVRGTDFYTDFSLGNGQGYFKNGVKISDRPWSDRSVAHVLPTYRWVIDNQGNSQLKASFDYTDAYSAGDSIKLSGRLDKSQPSTVKLFKSALKLTGQSVFTAALRSNQPLAVDAVLTFKDGSTANLPGDRQVGPGWQVISFDPRAYGGKVITDISLQFTAQKDVAAATINLGELSVFKQPRTWSVRAKQAVVDDQAFHEGGMVGDFRLSWQQGNKKNIRYFEVYRRGPDGSRHFLGSTDITHFFVGSLERDRKESSTTFEIVPVSRMGKDGKAATVTVTWPQLDPQPAFVADQTVVAPGSRVHFINRSNRAAAKFEWIFTGTDQALSFEKNPTVTYTKEGTYSVSLLVSDGNHHYAPVTAKQLITVTKDAAQGFADYAHGKSVTVDSFTNPNEDGSHAVDGDDRTKWCANSTDKHWLIVDLGRPTKVNSVRMKHAQAGGEDEAWNTADYTISVSDNQQDWTTVASVKGNQAAQTSDAFKQVTARYVKLSVDKPTQGTDNTVRLYGFEVLGLKQQ